MDSDNDEGVFCAEEESPFLDPLLEVGSALRREPIDPFWGAPLNTPPWRVRLPDGGVVDARVPAGLTREQARWALKPLFRGSNFHGTRVPDSALAKMSSNALTCAEVPGRGCVSFVRLEDDAAIQHALSADALATLGHVSDEAR